MELRDNCGNIDYHLPDNILNFIDVLLTI
jgi:hypothetical protein